MMLGTQAEFTSMVVSCFLEQYAQTVQTSQFLYLWAAAPLTATTICIPHSSSQNTINMIGTQ
jgi:hypothetical protein